MTVISYMTQLYVLVFILTSINKNSASNTIYKACLALFLLTDLMSKHFVPGEGDITVNFQDYRGGHVKCTDTQWATNYCIFPPWTTKVCQRAGAECFIGMYEDFKHLNSFFHKSYHRCIRYVIISQKQATSVVLAKCTVHARKRLNIAKST